MMINALNSGAKSFMADFEDALSPTWDNILNGQWALLEAVRGRLEYVNEAGKEYKLNANTATLVVRPRGWHMTESHVLINGEAISASLFDFGVYFALNAREHKARQNGPYFYLPKMESHLEARLWNDVFTFAQEYFTISHGTIRATVLIETLPAAFEMEEILFELRDHAAGLNAGRWDYIFSFIKSQAHNPDYLLPDRDQVTMTSPFMKAYANLLVETCHRRGAHAMGGMSAFIPNRSQPEVTASALAKVREDKRREALAGFDGSWIAHPDLASTVREEFVAVLGERDHQKDQTPTVRARYFAGDLTDPKIPGGTITETGLRKNISVTLNYLNHWLSGRGAAAIHNLMEDMATAEISRTQLWQCLHHHAEIAGRRHFDQELFLQWLGEESQALIAAGISPHIPRATEVLKTLVLDPHLANFMTTSLTPILNTIYKHEEQGRSHGEKQPPTNQPSSP